MSLSRKKVFQTAYLVLWSKLLSSYMEIKIINIVEDLRHNNKKRSTYGL